jgi:hypothetical protein
VHTAGITHGANSASIVLVNGGTYKLTFLVSANEPSQIAVFADGVLVPGTVYGSGAGTQQNGGQAIATFGAGATLTVRNHSSAAAIILQALAGGTAGNANASIVVEKIG